MAPLARRRALRGRALKGLAEGRRGLCGAQPVTEKASTPPGLVSTDDALTAFLRQSVGRIRKQQVQWVHKSVEAVAILHQNSPLSLIEKANLEQMH